ncbi:MAG: NAD(P)-dependent oxidoreductase [Clostridia bacterium]|nr:NAD(P)-dependent oxidoreductase [Clostridia bacterium]
MLKCAAITGATGAIGMGIIKALLGEGSEVYVFANPDSKRNHVLPRDERVHVIPCGLNGLKDFVPENGMRAEAFFHLGWAGTTGPGRDDMKMQNQNVAYSLDAVELAERLGCEVFVGTGSQAEYGRTDALLSPSTPTFPENGYGMGKLSAGLMTRMHARQRGIRHVWARILSVYGPYDGEHNLIMTIMRELMEGKAPEATAGEQVWSFLYSEDAAKGLLAMAERGHDGKIYMLGGEETDTLRHYLEDVARVVGREGAIRFGALPYREGQVMRLRADLSDTVRDLSWHPETSFTQGIEKTYAWRKA